MNEKKTYYDRYQKNKKQNVIIAILVSLIVIITIMFSLYFYLENQSKSLTKIDFFTLQYYKNSMSLFISAKNEYQNIEIAVLDNNNIVVSYRNFQTLLPNLKYNLIFEMNEKNNYSILIIKKLPFFGIRIYKKIPIKN